MFPIRAVEDDHVDRPGVEVRQRMKLTGTNSSIGLIVPIASAHLRLNAKHSCLSPAECEAFMRREQSKDVFIKTKRGFCPHQLLIGHKPLARFSPKLRFADLVVMAGWLHPFPFRTRP